MAESTTIEGTAAEGAAHEGGLPQMNTATFPSQLFWLVITFGALYIVMRRAAVPKIAGALNARKVRIEGDLADAEAARKTAADALAGYESTLAQARAKALAAAEDNRKTLNAEIDRLKAEADAKAHSATAAAEARIAAERMRVTTAMRASAAEAASAIVERLIGVSVSPDEAAHAVASDGKGG